MTVSAVVIVKIAGNEREIECESTSIHPAEPDVGIPQPFVEGWKAHHWSEPREFTQAEYDLISEADEERILEALDEALDDYDHDPW